MFDFFMAENHKNLQLKTNPYLMMGVLLMTNKDYDKAITYLKEGLKLEPTNFAIANNLGNCYKEKKYYVEALKYFNITIELNATLINTYQSRGICYINLEKYQLAINDFTFCIDQGFLFLSFFYRGYAYACLNKFETAILNYNQQISLDQQSLDSFLHRAIAYYNIGEFGSYGMDLNRFSYLSFKKKRVEFNRLLIEFWANKPYNLVWLSQQKMLTEISILDPSKQAFSKLKDFLFWFDFKKELGLFVDQIVEESERALLAFYGGCPVLTYIIYDEVLEMIEQPKGSQNYYALSLQQQYYFARSAMAIQTEAQAVLESAIETVEEYSLKTPEDAYYAGRIHLLVGNEAEAIESFTRAGSFVPAQIMLISLKENKELQTKHWQQLLKDAPEGLSYFLNGYSKEAFDFQFNKEGLPDAQRIVDQMQQFYYVQECIPALQQLIENLKGEIEILPSYNLSEIWEVFYIKPEDQWRLNVLQRKAETEKMLKELSLAYENHIQEKADEIKAQEKKITKDSKKSIELKIQEFKVLLTQKNNIELTLAKEIEAKEFNNEILLYEIALARLEEKITEEEAFTLFLFYSVIENEESSSKSNSKPFLKLLEAGFSTLGTYIVTELGMHSALATIPNLVFALTGLFESKKEYDDNIITAYIAFKKDLWKFISLEIETLSDAAFERKYQYFKPFMDLKDNQQET
jgi:hypothetical protein